MNDKHELSWWLDESMNPDVYEYVRDELSKVKALPAGERKKKVVHRIWCADPKCGARGRASSSRPSRRQLVAEVVMIEVDGRDCDVIRFRQRVKLPFDLPDPKGFPPGEHGRLALRARADRKHSKRLGEWQFYLVLDNADQSLLPLDCECTERMLSVANVMVRRHEGHESRVDRRRADPR